MSVSQQIDLWLGPLETIKSLQVFGNLYEKMRWSALSLETLAAPGLLVSQITCPEALVHAFEMDMSISQMSTKTVLGAFKIGAGEIVQTIRDMERGQQYLIALNATRTVLSPATAGQLFKLLINEMDPTTARRMTIDATVKTLTIATCTHVQNKVETEMMSLFSQFDEVRGGVDLDILVSCLRGLRGSERRIALPVRTQTEIATAILAWSFLDAQVLVRDRTGRICHILGNNTTKQVELFNPAANKSDGAVVPVARWISRQFPYGIRQEMPSYVSETSFAYLPAEELAAAQLRALHRADVAVMEQNIRTAWACIIDAVADYGWMDRAVFDVVTELDDWLKSQEKFLNTDGARFCKDMTSLYRRSQQREMSDSMDAWLHSDDVADLQEHVNKCLVTVHTKEVQDRTRLLVAVVLKAMQRNIDGRFSVHGDPHVFTMNCFRWLKNHDVARIDNFCELITGLGATAWEEGPVLISRAGLVVYNDYVLSEEPDRAKYFKVATGGAYLGKELVELVEGSKPRCSRPRKGQSELLPIDLTPQGLQVAFHLAFHRAINRNGEHQIEVVVEGHEGNSLNSSSALWVWPSLVLAAREVEERTDQMDVDDGNEDDVPDARRVEVFSPVGVGLTSEDSAVVPIAAAYQNSLGRSIACCTFEQPAATFLLVDNRRSTLNYLVEKTDVTSIVY